MNSVGLKTRRYVFTIPNYTRKDLKRFHALAESLEKHRYICYGLEIAPSTGTKHIQGYVELNDSKRFTFLHNYFNFTRRGKIIKFHIERAKGSAEQNKKYSQKEGDFFEFGTPVKQGERTDLREIKEAVKSNPKKLKEIVDDMITNYQQVRFAEKLQEYYLNHRSTDKPPKVYWIFGKTGIGKTSLVYRTFEDVCSVSSYQWMGTGYQQQECLLFDDFRFNDSQLKFEEILKITDRYPYTLFFKGGQIPLNSPFIVFTSPKSIEETFAFTNENMEQIKRRITQINLDTVDDIKNINLRELDEKYIYKNVKEEFDGF